MRAIMDRVFIKPDEKKKSAIIELDDHDETKSGIVVSVGEQVKSVKEGDHVIYYRWDDLPAVDGLVAVRENSLLGVYDE